MKEEVKLQLPVRSDKAMAYILTLKNSKNMQICKRVCVNTSIYAFVYFSGKYFNTKYPLEPPWINGFIPLDWTLKMHRQATLQALCVCCHQCQARKVNFFARKCNVFTLKCRQHATCIMSSSIKIVVTYIAAVQTYSRPRTLRKS